MNTFSRILGTLDEVRVPPRNVGINGDMKPGEIVKKCYVAAEAYAIHEVREAFEWRGRRILGPHIPLSALWEAAGETE